MQDVGIQRSQWGAVLQTNLLLTDPVKTHVDFLHYQMCTISYIFRSLGHIISLKFQ